MYIEAPTSYTKVIIESPKNWGFSWDPPTHSRASTWAGNMVVVALHSLILSSVVATAAVAMAIDDDAGPVQVNVLFVVFNVDSVDDRNSAVSLHMGMLLEWRDPSLVVGGNGSSFSSSSSSSSSSGERPLGEEELGRIRKPQVYFYSLRRKVSLASGAGGAGILVPSTGDVRWYLEHLVELSCSMEFGSYPMDSHVCPVVVGSVSQGMDRVVYTTDPEHLLRESSRFVHKLLPFKTSILRLEERDQYWEDASGLGYNYSTTGFRIRVQRRAEPFIYSWYLPSGLLVCISWIGFVIPVDLVRGSMYTITQRWFPFLIIRSAFHFPYFKGLIA